MDYLHFQSGPYGMLMRADTIREVLRPEQPVPLAAHVLWRSRPVPLATARQLLALDDVSESVLVVYGADAPRALLVDRIAGLRRVDDTDFVPLSGDLPPPVCRLFDGACRQSDGDFLLRCRDDWTRLDEESER